MVLALIMRLIVNRLQMVKNGGLATEWTYPYLSHGGQNYECKFQRSVCLY